MLIASFKCHSISVTFKFCAVLVDLCAPEPCSTDSLGTQHCGTFESHSNRVTFETKAISITSSIHACNYFPFKFVVRNSTHRTHPNWLKEIKIHQHMLEYPTC